MHYHDTSCDSVDTIKASYHAWMLAGRASYLAKTESDLATAQRKMDAAITSGMQRFEEAQQDEAWKEKNCKMCPSCSRVVYKIDGCNSMTCGRDAPDKGSGNVQDGCGHKFNWRTAPPYTRTAGDTARLPRSLSEVDPERAREVKHHIMPIPTSDTAGDGGGGEWQVMRFESSNFRLKCEHCTKDIIGPLFRCIHCPHFNVCIACSALDPDALGAKQADMLMGSSLEEDPEIREAKLRSLAAAAALRRAKTASTRSAAATAAAGRQRVHNGSHVFLIHFEDVADNLEMIVADTEGDDDGGRDGDADAADAAGGGGGGARSGSDGGSGAGAGAAAGAGDFSIEILVAVYVHIISFETRGCWWDAPKTSSLYVELWKQHRTVLSSFC